MAEQNPHRKTARTFAFVCYILAGVVFVAGVLFTISAALVDISERPIPGVDNQRLAIMVGSIFSIFVLMIALFGWRVQSLFGQPYRQEKLAAKSAVGCLKLGSLGCGLWAIPTVATAIMTGKILATGEPAGVRELFIGGSWFVIAISLMLSAAWFISANFAHLNLEERRRAYQSYLDAIRPYLHNLAEPATRTYVQEQTLDVLAKLDAPLKSTLLVFLSESGLLTGDTRIVLHDANFRCIDLRSINLPGADLRGINLERAALQGASLFKANLHKAKLKKADLTRANLQEADLRQADLTEAVLKETNLIDADLTAASVTPKQLNQARLKKNIIPNGTVRS